MVKRKGATVSASVLGTKKKNVKVALGQDNRKPRRLRSSRSNYETDMEEDPPTSQQVLLQNNIYASLDGGTDPKNSHNPKKGKSSVPPIVVRAQNFYEICQKIDSLSVKVTYKHMSIGTSILTNNVQEHKRVIEFLKTEKIYFFTHDVKSEKPFKVVLRGLHSITENELKEELTRKQLEPLSVFLMKRKSGVMGRDQPYLIHFKKPEVNLSTLRKNLPKLFYTVINWEPYVTTNRGPMFCSTCLIHGHGSKNCNMQPRCNICGKDHKTLDCVIIDPAVRKCANCKGNHAASSINCPKRQQYIEIREKIRQKNTVNKVRNNFARDPNLNLSDLSEFPTLLSNSNTNTFNNMNNSNTNYINNNNTHTNEHSQNLQTNSLNTHTSSQHFNGNGQNQND